MTGEDITMSRRDLQRLNIIHKALDKNISQIEAANILDLSDRQIRRIIKRIRKEGDDGIIHKSRGKPSHRTIPKKIKKKVIDLYRGDYKGFGPTFASEKLFEKYKIKVSHDTIRNWLIEEGIPYEKRKSSAVLSSI